MEGCRLVNEEVSLKKRSNLGTSQEPLDRPFFETGLGSVKIGGFSGRDGCVDGPRRSGGRINQIGCVYLNCYTFSDHPRVRYQ